MKYFLAKLLLFPLIAVINCQVAPTSEQTQCFTDAVIGLSNGELLEFQLCANDLSQGQDTLETLCSSGCFDLLQNIYTTCGYNGLAQICSGDAGGGGGGGGGFGPTDDQLQCFTDAGAAQALQVLEDCGSDFSDLSSICNRETCVNRFENIYSSCGYNGFSTQVCGVDGGGVGGGGSGGGFPDLPEPTDEQLQCIVDRSSTRLQEIEDACGDLSMTTDIRAICSNSACVSIAREIYDGCNYEVVDTICGVNYVDGGGVDGGDGDSFPDLPEPTDEQLQCFLDRTTPTIQQEFDDACGDFSTDADVIRALCNNSACVSIAREIYDGCNYKVIDIICGGSVRVYAVPVFVLISALLSMIFS